MIKSPAGQINYDFSNKTIEDFSVGTTGEGIVLKFYCPETKKTYTFVKPLTSLDIVLRIDRQARPQYEVSMKKQ
ncbi:MAG: hypothetical protein JXB03_03535 [Spirochaetales bacterium]|nr:hypothetical protein [Spirochaetales bacterium]